MSVLVKHMDIPKSCSDCPLNYDEMFCIVTGTRWWSDTMVLLNFDYTKERLNNCPLSKVPSSQPESSEITDEQAILHLQSTGWMQNHDKEMYESGQKSMLADDSGSYDALIPDCYKARKRFYNLSFLQPESECVFYDNDHGFCINTQDVVDNLNNQK